MTNHLPYSQPFPPSSTAVGSSSVFVETPLYLLHIADEVQAKYQEHLWKICAESSNLDVEEGEEEGGAAAAAARPKMTLKLEDYRAKEESVVKAELVVSY